MSDAREHQSETQPQTGGVMRDLKHLQSDGAATVAEIREFLGEMKGRRPQEMLGMVAKSGLTRSILLAIFLFAVVLIASTVVPYYWYGPPSGASAGASSNNAAATPAADDDQEAQPAEDAADKIPATTDDGASDSEPGPDRAIEAMGIGETKTPEPGDNEMEDRLDKLLDGIE
jgi:hypothetical protein